jgi:hypothetical protein
MDSTFNDEELARGDEQLARLEEQLSKLGRDATHNPPLLQPRMSRFRFAFPGGRLSLGGWVLRGFTGLLLVACIGVAAIAWRRSSDNDAAKAAPAQPAPLAQTAREHVAPSAAAASPELTQLLQPMARELATRGKEIERLEMRQEQLARDNANVVGQLKASQEQMARDIANVSEQLKASQEQIARDNSNLAEQLKASQEQMARDIAKVSEQNPSPKIPVPSPRPTVTSTRKPVPTLPSSQLATAKPQTKKPQLSSVPQRSTPVR